MAKKFNLSSKSDMRKLEKSLMNDAKSMARKKAESMTFDVNCPHCSKPFKAHKGSNICPFCKNEVDMNLEFNF